MLQQRSTTPTVSQRKKRYLGPPVPPVIVISDDEKGDGDDDRSEGDDDVLMHSDESRTRTVRWVCWVAVSVRAFDGNTGLTSRSRQDGVPPLQSVCDLPAGAIAVQDAPEIMRDASLSKYSALSTFTSTRTGWEGPRTPITRFLLPAERRWVLVKKSHVTHCVGFEAAMRALVNKVCPTVVPGSIARALAGEARRAREPANTSVASAGGSAGTLGTTVEAASGQTAGAGSSRRTDNARSGSSQGLPEPARERAWVEAAPRASAAGASGVVQRAMSEGSGPTHLHAGVQAHGTPGTIRRIRRELALAHIPRATINGVEVFDLTADDDSMDQ